VTTNEVGGTKPIRLQNVLQVCVVVEDLQKAMQQYWEVFGIGPWEIGTFRSSDISNATLHGKPASFGMRGAVARIGNILWELLQPLEGESAYREFLDKKGVGVHHVCVSVENYDECVEEMQKRGIGILMGGSLAGTSFVYMDTEKTLGTVIELIKMPPNWAMAPQEVYPPNAKGSETK